MFDKVTSCLGYVTEYNPLSIQNGALAKAKNCYIRRKNIIEDRRGNALYATLGSNITQFLKYSSRLIVHNGTILSYDNGSGTFSNYSGSYSAPTGYKMRGAEAFSNLYVTTASGVQVLTDVAGTAARKSGMPRALDPSLSLNAASTGFLTTLNQCAYRAVLKRTDANSLVITGYPSQRAWVYNSAGTDKNIDITMYLPIECVAGDTVEFYRTKKTSGSTSDKAGDECFLCYRYALTSTDITNGYITFTDSVVDELLGDALYTNQSQEGIAQANDRPPLCKDLALHKSRFMMYANCSTKHRLYFTLVGTAAISAPVTSSITNTSTSVTLSVANSNILVGWKVFGLGIQAGTTVSAIAGTSVTLSLAATATNASASLVFVTNQTIILAGQTYSFSTTENASTGVVGVSYTGVAANDIDLTARSFIRVINRYASNTSIYAYYISGADDLPGKIMTEERGIGASAFTVQSSSTALSTMFYPAPPVSPSTNSQSTSSNQVEKNMVYVAKDGQPEHVPVLQKYPVGPSNKEILRLIALRDSTIVIKEEGIYRLVGETAQSIVVIEMDKTVFCKASDSVALLSNQVFMLSNQGVVAISENGVSSVSLDIDPTLLPLLTVSNLKNLTAGFGYESERSYFLSIITNTTDTVQNRTLVYNIFTKAWVEHGYAFTAGLVEDGVDKLFFAPPSAMTIFRERKSFSNDDYYDPESAIVITGISGRTVSFTASGRAPAKGWVISQGGTTATISTMSAVSGVFNAVMSTDLPAAWAPGAAIAYPHVGMEIEWHSWTAMNPGFLKQVHGVGFLADDIDGYNTVSAFTATFRSNFDPELEEVPIQIPSGAGWGSAWGASPWGDGSDPCGYPTYVPQNKQMCNRLKIGIKHESAGERMSIAGFVTYFTNIGEGVGR